MWCCCVAAGADRDWLLHQTLLVTDAMSIDVDACSVVWTFERITQHVAPASIQYSLDRHHQERNFGLKSGGTNSEGDRAYFNDVYWDKVFISYSFPSFLPISIPPLLPITPSSLSLHSLSFPLEIGSPFFPPHFPSYLLPFPLPLLSPFSRLSTPSFRLGVGSP